MVLRSRRPGDHGHVPVLLDRCVELLHPALTRQHPDGSGAVLVDATLGAGGHAERFLTELPGLRLIGLDRDPNALWIAGERLSRFADRVTLVRTRYDGIESALAESGYWRQAESVDGMLFDLGVSSMQLDRTERGFSYAADAPLDMRMDPDCGADRRRDRQHLRRDRAGTASCASSARSGSPAASPRRSSAAARTRPFSTTGELVELLYQAIPAPRPAHRRTSGQAHVPGAAHRRQRRAGLAARRASRRARTHWPSAAASW